MSSRSGVTCHLDPDEFQFFFGLKLMIEYQEFQEIYFDMHIMMVMFVLCVCFYLGRCNVSHPFDDGFYFTTSFCCTITSFFLYHIFLFRYVVKYLGATENSRLYRVLDYFVHSKGGQGNILNDITAIIGVVGVGFGLFARVFKGQCEQNVSIWEAQRCNPAANSFSLPQDHVVFLLILPLHCQSVINGMTFRATLICWLITVISIIIAIKQVGGAMDIWIVHLSLIILGIAYKNEKLARLTFAHNKKISLAEEEKMKYIVLQQQTERQLLLVKNRHELEILSIKAEEECRLMVKEKKQMVALIGNVAHDLKTPLQSFLMDLESLKADPGLKKRECRIFYFIYFIYCIYFIFKHTLTSLFSYFTYSLAYVRTSIRTDYGTCVPTSASIDPLFVPFLRRSRLIPNYLILFILIFLFFPCIPSNLLIHSISHSLPP